MKVRRVGVLCVVVLAFAACASRPVRRVTSEAPLPSVEAATATLASLKAAEPATFKMVHQVVARFQGKSFLMTGYLLGRRDGDFRVSAVAAMGPRLFDVAKLHGEWDAEIHLSQLEGRVDPRNIGRAVERIYFLDASGPLQPGPGVWTSSSAISGDPEVDRLETSRDGQTLALVKKQFFQGPRPVVEVDFDPPEPFEGRRLSRHVKLKDARGFELELEVTRYEPGFAVPEEKLRLHPH